LGDEIRKNEMGGTRNTCGDRRGAYRVLAEKPEGKRPLGNPGVDGGTMVKWIFKKWIGGVNRIDLVHNRDRWRPFEPSSSIKCGEFLD
jgi:hypothetical protein